MLPTTTEFDASADANTTEANCKVEIEREYNAIAPTINVTAAHDPVDPRFHKDNVVKIDNPRKRGVAYGPVREMFTSDDPSSGFRLIESVAFDKNRDVAYYIPEYDATSPFADVTVDYDQDYNMNCIEVRYENSRTKTTTYDSLVEIRVTPDGGGETEVYEQAMKDDGVTRIYWNGSTWSESKSGMDADGTGIREVRVRILQNSYVHQPRIMYIGGLHVVDVSDDIIDVTVNKTEFEQSAYLPIGEPSGNTCSISLDNTNKRYRFGDQIANYYFLKNQRITVQFGLNVKYGGGADAYEYVSGGIFYVGDFGYDESEMTVNISGQDFSKKLQETFCGNYLWQNKSLKYIVHDVLARSGISPRGVVFDFGIASNADESNKRQYTWSHEEQTVWDFLSDLAKSELGTVFYDEEENLVFTDRLDIDSKSAAGIQYTFSAGTNLEGLNEQFEVGANKVKVAYEKLSANTSAANVQLVRDSEGVPNYELGPEIQLNSVLWQPESGDSYLGSAVLSRTLKPGHSSIYVTPETAVQITRDEGELLIGDEFIKYDNYRVLGNGTGVVDVVERDSRGTVFGSIPTYRSWQSGHGVSKRVLQDRSSYPNDVNPHLTKYTTKGLRQWRWSRSNSFRKIMTATTFNGTRGTQNYNVYGVRFRFNELPYGYHKDQAAGIFINAGKVGTSYRGIFLEVSNPERAEAVRPDAAGNVRAFKASSYMTVLPLPADPKLNDDEFAKTVLYDEAQRDIPGDEGTYIDITVIETDVGGYDDVRWYVNGEYMGEFKSGYSQSYLNGLGFNTNQQILGATANESGDFGVFTRGSTDITVDFIYASNDLSTTPDDTLQTKGFRKYYDTHSNSWRVKRDYTNKPFLIEFGTPVHEVVTYDADHETYPNLYARVMNTDEETVSVFEKSSSPFTSKIVVGNTSRIGVDLNNTVFYPDGTSLDHSFLVYGVGVIRSEKDRITTSDAKSIRRYGIEEVEMDNPWVNSKDQAISLATHIRKYWSTFQQFYDLDVMPNPALQVRDRVNVLYTDKGFDGSGVWFVNGISLTYDGGLSSTVTLKRYEDYPTGDLDYREEGGIIIT